MDAEAREAGEAAIGEIRRGAFAAAAARLRGFVAARAVRRETEVEALFREWYALPPAERGGFWEWLWGRAR